MSTVGTAPCARIQLPIVTCQWLSGSASRLFAVAIQTNRTSPTASGQDSAHEEHGRCRTVLSPRSLETERPEVTAIGSSEITERNQYNALIYNIFWPRTRGLADRIYGSRCRRRPSSRILCWLAGVTPTSMS